MDKKKRKFSGRKYSERHLRRLANNETDLFLNVTQNDSNTDDSDSEANGSCRPTTSRSFQNEDNRTADFESHTGLSSPHQSVDQSIASLSADNFSSTSSKDSNSSFTSTSTDSSSSSDVEDDRFIALNSNQGMPESPTTSFSQDLVQWAVKFNIPHNALSSLLATLNNHTDFNLPNDSRTLLKTPRQVQIHQFPSDNGLYYHFGLDRVLSAICMDYVLNSIKTDIINLIMNVDGLPISKSSTNSIWPILCSDSELSHVHLVGAYYGSEKPKSANDFLKRVVEELINFIENGFIHDGKRFHVKLYALVCDAPAKAFVLSVKGHTGYSSCPKCTIHGDSLNNRVYFEDCSAATPRTYETFLSQVDDNYHNGESILINVPHFDPVLDVPSDYMHQICLGVMKKIITLLIKGPLSVRISGTQISRISAMLENLKGTVPSEFVRKPRGLLTWKQWKATELREFLLYLGPFVLKNVLRPDIYLNFLTIHVAVTILSSPIHVSEEENLQYAQELLGHFVQSFGIIYGNQFISQNVHVLLHLVDDVRKYGPLDNFSAFRFENYMQEIKKKIRKSDRPLQQLAKRLEERYILRINKPANEVQTSKSLMHSHENGPLPTDLLHVDAQYRTYKTENFVLNSEDEKNSCCMMKDGTVVLVSNIVVINNESFIVGKRHSIIEDFFSTPCQSSTYNIHIVQFENSLRLWRTQEIAAKMWKMPHTHQRCFVVFPVLHTTC